MEISSRRVVFANVTAHPGAGWAEQEARNLIWATEEAGIQIRRIVHDRDSKFSPALDAILTAAGVTILRTPYRSPRANARCECLLGSLRRESLDWLLVWDERHLLRILRQYFCHYNHARPHRALGLRAPDPPRATAQGQVVRVPRVAGLINEYVRVA